MAKVSFLDLLFRIRQSAQGTKRRVFIVETMGGNIRAGIILSLLHIHDKDKQKLWTAGPS